MWKERMEKKGSLGIYKASKQEIRKENFYDNNKGQGYNNVGLVTAPRPEKMALVVGLEQFVPQLSSQDTKKRLQLGATLLSYLDDPLNLVDCTEMGAVIDGLVAWLNSSNSKKWDCVRSKSSIEPNHACHSQGNIFNGPDKQRRWQMVKH
ncbi:hypothetical protein HPB51_011282 [Rhipicephalus microplus]|uniref:Uncharacterized protein n=1 Tax=Rhipicephalus microplus TaxID=6941 RepID=A0A9J6DMN1_RHIMP|nr:hypothetical protein HPB51_011282 [Rhipicephalus microplus]